MRKLSSKLTLHILIIVFVGMISLSIYNVLKTRNLLIENTIKEQRNHLDIFNRALLSQLEILKNDITFLESSPFLSNGQLFTGRHSSGKESFLPPSSPPQQRSISEAMFKSTHIKMMMTDLMNNKPNYVMVEVLDFTKEGQQLLLLKREKGEIIDLTDSKVHYSNEPYYTEALKLGRKQVHLSSFNSHNFSHFNSNSVAIEIRATLPIFDETEKVVGLISYVREVSDTLETLEFEDSSETVYYFFQKDGSIIKSSSGKETKNIYDLYPELSQEDFENKNFIEIEDSLIVNSKFFYSRYNPNLFVNVALKTDKAKLNQVIYQKIKYDVVVFFAIITLCLFLAIFYIKEITKPLSSLKKVAELFSHNTIEEMELSLEKIDIADTENDNEVGVLSNTLLKMSHKIISQNSQLDYQKKALDLVSLVSISDEFGVIEDVNSNFCHACKYTKAELVGTELKFLSSNLHTQKFIRNIEATVLRGDIWSGEIRNKDKYGDIYWTNTSIVPVKDQKQVVRKLITISTDITEKIKQQEKVEELTQHKERFLATMSHEIRTPLNAILGMLTLLSDESLSEEGKNHLNVMKQNGKSLMVLINDILDFSKIEAGKLQVEYAPLNINFTIQQTINLFKGNCEEKNIKIHYSAQKDIPILLSDDTRIRQVLSNLLSNAIKFSNENDIKVRTHYENLEDERVLMEVSVEDQGIGIKDTNLSNLFQSFSQADNSTSRKYGGTGLGLAISKGICHALGGDIWVESHLGEGSKFTFSLVAEQTKNTVVAVEDDLDLNLLSQMNVLIVDDNAINRSIAMKFFEKMNIKVTVVDSGQEAITLAKKTPFDLIFMDSHMPEMNGVETTEKIRNHFKSLEHPWIIAFTADELTKEQVQTYQMNGYLQKPMNSRKIKSILIKFLNEYQQRKAS